MRRKGNLREKKRVVSYRRPIRSSILTIRDFKFYERVVGRVFGQACFYGQVIKMRRNDRVKMSDTLTRAG